MACCNRLPTTWLHSFCTSKFIKDHLACEGCGKKKAENLFQHRDVSVSTLLVYTRPSWTAIMEEIMSRQNEYAQNPNELFDTLVPNDTAYLERRKKHAKFGNSTRFKYGVRQEEGLYKLHHFHERV